MDGQNGAQRMRTKCGWFATVVFCLLCASQLAQGASTAGTPGQVANLRVIRAFFPSISLRYATTMTAVPNRARSYGGNSTHYLDTEKFTADGYGPLRVAVISDLNSSYGSTDYRSGVYDAIQEIIRRRPDIVISAGDMVAGQRHGLDYRAMWQAFHHAVTRPLEQAGIPLLVTAGNHDGPRTPRYAYQREIYIDEWTQHRPKVSFVDDTHYPEFYSVAMGPVLFLAVDSSTVGALGKEQMQWLEEQLKHGQDFPVKIVFGHVPMWAVSRGREREIIGDDALEAMLERYGVDAFIAGHDHAYYPGVRGTIRYVSAPALGTGPRHLLAPRRNRSPRGFMEFYAGVNGGIYDLESWKVPDFTEIDARETLPPKVGSGRAPLVRDDLVDMDQRSHAFGHGGVIRTPVDPSTLSDEEIRRRAETASRASKKAPRSAHDASHRAPRKEPSRAPNGQRALPSDLFRD